MIINQDQLIAILETARFAPSVHNTQPWKVALLPECIHITLDNEHVIRDGDPTGRQTIISLGIFVEAISISAKALGLDLDKAMLSKHGAKLYFTQSPSSIHDNSDVKLLMSRSTDRSIYTQVTIPHSLEDSLHEKIASTGIEAFVVKDKAIIDRIAGFTSQGISLALSNPAFRNELSQYLIEPWSSAKRGIAVKSLAIPLYLAVLQPFMVKRGLGNGEEVKQELKRWQSSSAVILLAGNGDLSKYWLETGRAYLRVCLLIEAAGLSQATSAAIVEASNFHEDIESMIGTKKRILALIRIGKGTSPRQTSPRLSAEDLLTSS